MCDRYASCLLLHSHCKLTYVAIRDHATSPQSHLFTRRSSELVPRAEPQHSSPLVSARSQSNASGRHRRRPACPIPSCFCTDVRSQQCQMLSFNFLIVERKRLALLYRNTITWRSTTFIGTQLILDNLLEYHTMSTTFISGYIQYCPAWETPLLRPC